jgi:hypothetical protein
METQDATVRKCDCRPGRSLSTEGARTGAGAPSGTAFYRNRVREPNPGARGLAGGEGRGGAAAFEGECRGRRGRRRGGGGDREGARRGVRGTGRGLRKGLVMAGLPYSSVHARISPLFCRSRRSRSLPAPTNLTPTILIRPPAEISLVRR